MSNFLFLYQYECISLQQLGRTWQLHFSIKYILNVMYLLCNKAQVRQTLGGKATDSHTRNIQHDGYFAGHCNLLLGRKGWSVLTKLKSHRRLP
jgi:hypothetical protein